VVEPVGKTMAAVKSETSGCCSRSPHDYYPGSPAGAATIGVNIDPLRRNERESIRAHRRHERGRNASATVGREAVRPAHRV
jgi:hypothetical protein